MYFKSDFKDDSKNSKQHSASKIKINTSQRNYAIHHAFHASFSFFLERYCGLGLLYWLVGLDTYARKLFSDRNTSDSLTPRFLDKSTPANEEILHHCSELSNSPLTHSTFFSFSSLDDTATRRKVMYGGIQVSILDDDCLASVPPMHPHLI